MLDAYGGLDTLAESYDYDNAPFLQSLSKNGFHVVQPFHSNYPYTEFSVATLLNMRYELHPDGSGLNETFTLDAKHARLMSASESVRDSRVVRDLKRMGYRHLTFQTGFSSVEIPSADQHFAPERTISDLEGEFINQTMLAPLLRAIGAPYHRYFQARDHRRRVAFTCETLLRLEVEEAPQFVWAHLLIPHQPFVFDAEGNPKAPPASREEIARVYHERYREQLQYTNKLMAEVLVELAVRRPDSVIVVLGDHGPRYLEEQRKYEWPALARDFASTIYAVKFPEGRVPAAATEAATHVNVFRALFRDIFGADLPNLPDVSFLPREQGSSEYVAVAWDGTEPRIVSYPGE